MTRALRSWPALGAALLIACGPRIYRETPAAIAASALEVESAAGSGEVSQAVAARLGTLHAATKMVAGALENLHPDDPAWVRGVFIDAVYAGDLELATNLLGPWQPASDDRKAQILLVRLAIETGNFSQARELAWERMHTQKAQWTQYRSLWHDALEQDPTLFSSDVLTIEPGVQLTRLERLGGGSTITLKFKLEDVTVGAFKPYQNRFQSNYRAEIAAYRLCELIHCAFEVPQNTEVRIAEDDFLDLYGLSSLRGNDGYAAGFGDLLWFEDAAGERWLHGTLKEWVPGFTQFPIEFTDVWEPLVSDYINRERLEAMTFEDAVRGLANRDRGNRPGIVERAEDTTALGLAHQISNLHVFDYLLNNWDRYSGEFWGVNCQWNHGHFVSIDNGASLQASSSGAHASGTTWNRLGRVHVFSRRTIEAIRALDPERTYALLFPERAEHPDERDRFKLFMERRTRLLNRIDSEIEARGIDDVLIFD